MLNEVYNRRIIELAGTIPRIGRLADPDASATALSKLCGSTVTIDLKMDGDTVTDFAHEVKACALGQASSSIMASHIIGSKAAELRELRDSVRKMLKENGAPPADGKWADIAVLEPVRDYKARHASTLLTFDAVVDAIGQIEQEARPAKPRRSKSCPSILSLRLRHAPRLVGRGMVKIYRHTLSPLVGFECRHLPTCSDYADQALDRFGLWAGGWMTLARLLRCQPCGTAGLDFIPETLPEKSHWYMPWRYGRWRGTNSGPAFRTLKNTENRPAMLTCIGSQRVSKQERMMVALTFPDGARRDYPNGTTGLDIAKGISPSLAKRTVAMALDGKLADLADPIEHDAKIEFLTRDDPRALELIRHDAAHVLAEAVQTLWPGTQVTIGPVIENGFYYDFFRNAPFTPEDFRRHRKEDARDRRARQTVHQGNLVARRRQASLRRHGRELQGRAGRRHPERPADQNLQAGRLVRSVPRAAHDLDRQDRQCFQADESGRRLLAGRFKPRNAVAHLWHRVRQAGRARRLPQADRGGGKARPPETWPRNGPVPFPGRSARFGVLAPQRLDAVPDAGKLHPPPPGRRRLCRSQRAAAYRFVAVGGVGPYGDVPRSRCSSSSRARRTSAPSWSSR